MNKDNLSELEKNDIKDLENSKNINIDNVKTVCLMLGPYRNLTTLTASILFLHPNCQVLNHGASRIYGKKEIDFLDEYEKNKMDRFIQFAIQISGKGKRGKIGGSITYSHAFDDKHKMKDIYKRASLELIKEDIQCLFWKESLHTSNIIKKRKVDLEYIFQQEKRLKFLLPIRNPLDCAVSNLSTGLISVFEGRNKKSNIFEAIESILDEIFWFESLKKQFPDRFFYFLEYDLNTDTLLKLKKFLNLSQNEEWIKNANEAINLKKGYRHSPEIINFYKNYIKENGSEYPELSQKLIKFINL